jgi:hypothetical protein
MLLAFLSRVTMEYPVLTDALSFFDQARCTVVGRLTFVINDRFFRATDNGLYQ